MKFRVLLVALLAIAFAAPASAQQLFDKNSNGPFMRKGDAANGAALVEPGPVTPKACTVAAVATGGTAVTLATGPLQGGYVTNPANAAAQGVTSENVYLDMVGTPGSTDGAANGTTILLAAGQTFTLPALPPGVTVKLNAATSGHKVTCAVYP